MRGYGDSDKPEGVSPYDVDNLSDDIKALIKELGREKCILVCHDWGAVVGWHFIQNNMQMVEKYVMMGAPSAQAWRKVIMSSEFLDQFKKSWYIFYFQMPRLPEYTISLNDFAVFKAVGSKNKSDTYSEDDMEAYKYTFSRPGELFFLFGRLMMTRLLMFFFLIHYRCTHIPDQLLQSEFEPIQSCETNQTKNICARALSSWRK